MRFTKKEISLLISYLDPESIEYCQRIDAFICILYQDRYRCDINIDILNKTTN